MAFDKVKQGRILIEVRVLNPEKLLNILWSRGIKVYKAKKKNVATMILEIDYLKYIEVEEIVNKLGGSITLVKSKGFIFFLGSLKKRLSLGIGCVLFLGILYYLSTYIWAVQIDTQKNIPPFVIRQELMQIGIKPGIAKKSIDVKEIEKKLENINSEILWVRVRIEGSTLKVVLEEKINPPKIEESEYGNLVAKMDGEITKIYTFSGRAVVTKGQNVKAGDVLIEGMDGNEELKYILPARGVVVAKTLYEKMINVKLTGTTLERSGNKDSDVYISVFGKRIYLKKAIKGFEHYDKIENSGKIFNKVLYYERVEKEIDLDEDQAINEAVNEVEKSLLNELTREAVLVDKIIETKKEEDGNALVKVIFVIEQNIVNDILTDY